MTTLVVNRVTRIAIVGEWTNALPCVNTLDLWWSESGGIGDRGDLIDSMVRDVANNWQDHIVPSLSNNYSLLRFDFVDLNSADGLTGTLSPDPSKAHVGTNTAAALPPSQCLLVNKTTTHRRGARSGRWYIPGQAEQDLDENGNWLSSVLASWATLLDDFLSGVSDDGVIELEHYPVVVHANSATSSRITSLDPQPLVGYMGRRIGR